MGPTGTGKTHLAVSLGLAACRQGHRVRFTTAAGLINDLIEAQAQLRLSKALELALQYRCVSADAVRHLLHRMESTWQPPLPLDLESLGLTAPKVPMADPSQYNRLLRIA